ncbi:MAG: hypothetical protein ACOCRK_06300 [bacterium]
MYKPKTKYFFEYRIAQATFSIIKTLNNVKFEEKKINKMLLNNIEEVKKMIISFLSGTKIKDKKNMVLIYFIKYVKDINSIIEEDSNDRIDRLCNCYMILNMNKEFYKIDKKYLDNVYNKIHNTKTKINEIKKYQHITDLLICYIRAKRQRNLEKKERVHNLLKNMFEVNEIKDDFELELINEIEGYVNSIKLKIFQPIEWEMRRRKRAIREYNRKYILSLSTTNIKTERNGDVC